MNRPKKNQATIAGKNGFSLISNEKFQTLYAALLQCTMLDQRLRGSAAYERWTGREAGTAGVVADLRPADTILPTARGLLAGYLLGGRLIAPVEKSVTAQLAAATGQGLRHKLEKSGNVAVVFTGANTKELQNTREIFQVAASQKLPVLYILEGDAPLTEICEDLPVIRVDGSDTIAVYRVAHESIQRLREGGSPTVIQCSAWPAGDRKSNPLEKLENYLAAKGLSPQSWKRRMEAKFDKALDHAVAAGFERR